LTNEIEPGLGHPSEPPAHTVRASRWALSVPVGVIVCIGAGIIFGAIVGDGQPEAGWQQNVVFGVIVLVGSLATGTVARARTRSDWIRAVILTIAGLLAFVVALFVYVAANEPPR
jgi:multisubunit Na+/H+ antiporter MnhB subunit